MHEEQLLQPVKFTINDYQIHICTNTHAHITHTLIDCFLNFKSNFVQLPLKINFRLKFIHGFENVY